MSTTRAQQQHAQHRQGTVLPAVALLVAAGALAYVGLRALGWQGLVVGEPLTLTALAVAASAVGFDVGRHPVAALDRRTGDATSPDRPRGGRGDAPRADRGVRPGLRLLLVLTLSAAFAWISGWSLLLPAIATLTSVVHIEAAGSRLWRPAVALQLTTTALGQVGVALGLVPSVVDPLASHVAATAIALPCTVTVAYVGRSVGQREAVDASRRRTEARLNALMNASSDVVAVIDADASLTYVSPAAAPSLARDPAGLVGTDVLDLVDRDQRAEVRDRLAEIAAGPPGTRASLDVLMVLAAEERRWHEWTVVSLLDDPLVRGLVVVMRDVSERLLHAEALARAAAVDPLTGLANRTEFLRLLRQALPQAAPGAGVALLFLDLDGFKTINDTHGHAVGDEVLVAIARRLEGSIRPHDVVARLGGDEFCVLVTETRDEAEASAVARRVEEAVQEPVSAGGLVLRVGGSVGMAVTTESGHPAAELFAHADAAMYRTKHARRGHLRVAGHGRGAAPESGRRANG